LTETAAGRPWEDFGMTEEQWRRELAEEVSYQHNKRLNPLMYHKTLRWQKSMHGKGLAKSIRAAFGGNQVGKTTFSCYEMMVHLTQMYPDWWPMECRRDGLDGRPGPPMEGFQAGPDFDNWLEQVYLPKFHSLMPQDVAEPIKIQGKIRGYRFQYMNHGTGEVEKWSRNTIHFLSYLQDTFAYEGKTIDFAGFDEPPPFRIWTATKRGLMKRDGIAMFPLTPLTEPWIDSEIAEREDVDPNIHTRRVTIWENCVENGGYLRRDQIEDFLRGLPEDERLAREQGISRHLAGQVYPEICDDHKVDDFPIPWNWTRYEGVDPHGARPTCVLFCAVDPDGRRYYHDRLVIDGGPREIFHAVMETRAKHGGVQPRWTVLDRKASQQESNLGEFRTSWAKELKKAGFRNLVYSDSSPGSVGVGVRIVKQGLEMKYDHFHKKELPEIFFFREACGATTRDRRGAQYGVIYQLRRLQWEDAVRKSIHEKASVDKVKEVDKDFPDCVRYIEERLSRQSRKYLEPREYGVEEEEERVVTTPTGY
jgi:hypothetical protein